MPLITLFKVIYDATDIHAALAVVNINYWNFLKAIHSKNASFPIFMSTIDFACQITNILYTLLNLGSFQLQNSKKFSIKDFKRVLFMLVLWIYLFLVALWMSYTPFISNFYSMTILYSCHSIGMSKMNRCRLDAKYLMKNANWFYHRCKCLLWT